MHFYLVTILGFIRNLVLAQSPTQIPRPESFEPVDFSKILNILFYIGIPILFFIIYRIWMKNKKRK